MRQYSLVSVLVIWLSVLCAALLQIMPLPPIIDSLRPNWVLLVGLYWSIALPHRFNLGSAWICGIIVDLIWGTTLGINALAFVVSHAIVVVHFQKIRSFSIWQQALLMCSISLLYQTISYIAELWLNDVSMPSGYFHASFVPMLAWAVVIFSLA